MSTTNDGYCHGCYGEAKKKGRAVRMTELCEYPLCPICESRMRNGLIHYLPSNGTEGRMFQAQCNQCRHCTLNKDGFETCAFGILDKMLESGWEDRDGAKSWYDPADLRTEDLTDGHPLCPAECLRYTSKDDPNGALRDPPPKDCIGQLMLGELLTVRERKIQPQEVSR